MKKGDFIWGGLFLGFCIMLVVPGIREAFIAFTETHKLIGGFVKFSILATMGELLAIRVGNGEWVFPCYFITRVVIWGFIGMLLTMIFTIYATGVENLQKIGILPFEGMNIAFAFFTAALMNATFGPTFMYAHRISDTYLDMRHKGVKDLSLTKVVQNIDTASFVTFVIVKTIPIFWIPAHTLTFLLPSEYRVLAAAMLSIALGLILTVAKRKKSQTS
ncbi:MAG: hypothetical protein ACERLG_06930 [Sedimentibacter sp.]